jgi:predicted flap endonuclease-1-like 5' DNA nuclease
VASALQERLEALESAPATLPAELAARLEVLENGAPTGVSPELLARLDALETRASGVSPAVVDGLQARIEALEAKPRPAPATAPATAAAGRQPKPTGDPIAADLQRVKGIGKSWAQKLAAAGVESVEAVARWSDDDVARLAKSLSVAAKKLKGWRTAAKDV